MPRRTSYASGVPCWVDTITPDLTASAKFYAELFGWKYDDEGGYRIIRQRGEIVGGMAAAPVGQSMPAFWSTYLSTKDLDQTGRLVSALGGTTVMGPLEAGNDGRLSLAIDPYGAAVGFWEGHRADGVVLVDEPGALCWHELRSTDPDTVMNFYGALFADAVLNRDPVGRATIDIAGTPYVEVTTTSALPTWIPYFAVTDCAVALERAEHLGARVEFPSAAPDSAAVRLRSRTAVLTDPCGAVLGLRELPG